MRKHPDQPISKVQRKASRYHNKVVVPRNKMMDSNHKRTMPKTVMMKAKNLLAGVMSALQSSQKKG